MSILKGRIRELEKDVEALKGDGSVSHNNDDSLNVKKVFNGLSEEVDELDQEVEAQSKRLAGIKEDMEEVEENVKDTSSDLVDTREQLKTKIDKAIENLNERLDTFEEQLESKLDASDVSECPDGSSTGSNTTKSKTSESGNTQDDDTELPEV